MLDRLMQHRLRIWGHVDTIWTPDPVPASERACPHGASFCPLLDSVAEHRVPFGYAVLGRSEG